MSKRSPFVRVVVGALSLSTFACLALTGPPAASAEYEVRVLDPLPEGFVRFDASFFRTEPPVTPSIWAQSERRIRRECSRR